MEVVLWIENIVETTSTPPFFTNFRVDIIGFVSAHKLIVKRNVFSALLSAWNGGESKGEEKNVKKYKNHEKKKK